MGEKKKKIFTDPENYRISMAGCSGKSKLTRRYGQRKEGFAAITFITKFFQLTQYLISYAVRLT
jgi:hypothetical protein